MKPQYAFRLGMKHGRMYMRRDFTRRMLSRKNTTKSLAYKQGFEQGARVKDFFRK